MKLVRACAVLLAVAATSMHEVVAGDKDLTDTENQVVTVLEKIGAAEEEFRKKRVKVAEGEEPSYGTLDELVAARLAPKEWASVAGYTITITVSEELPSLLYVAIATPPKAAGDSARHFAANNAGPVYALRRPLKVDPKSMETFSFPTDKVPGTAVKGKLSKEEQAAEDARLAKIPAATLGELAVIFAMGDIAAAQPAHEIEHGTPGTLEQLAKAKMIRPSLGAGKMPGYTLELGLIPPKGPDGHRFWILARPEKPGPGAHFLLRTPRADIFYSEKPIETDEAGEPRGGAEPAGDMVVKAMVKIEADAAAGQPCELLAEKTMRILETAETGYIERDVPADETATYGTLKDLRAHELIDDKLASGKRWGYVFTVTPMSKTPGKGYAITANPEKANTGARSFFTNHKRELCSSRDPITADPATCEPPKGTEPVWK
jgi:hypothetical protein